MTDGRPVVLGLAGASDRARLTVDQDRVGRLGGLFGRRRLF